MSLRKLVLSSSSAAAPRSGTEVDGGGEVKGAVGASIDECDSGEEDALSVSVTGESEVNGGPVGSIWSRT